MQTPKSAKFKLKELIQELPIFAPVGMILFFIVFNYTILRNTKDVLINTAPHSGPEVISFLKGWCVMPAAILFVMLYTKLCNNFSQTRIFYSTATIFLIFFVVFAFIIYPNKDLLHFSTTTIAKLQMQFPRFKWVVPIFGYWSYSLFYLFAELWGTIMISLMFWQTANNLFTSTQAAKYYTLLSFIGNLAMTIAGISSEYVSKIKLNSSLDWGYTLKILAAEIVVMVFGMMFCYYWVNNKSPYFKDKSIEFKSKKTKLDLVESGKYIIKSPYLGLVVILIIGYGLSASLIEAIWKKYLVVQYPNPNDYSVFMGKLSKITGLVTIIVVAFGSNIVTRIGWLKSALITPIVTLITSSVFVFAVFTQDKLTAIAITLGISVNLIIVIFGTIQNCLSKGVKYTIFDPTKEMTFIPLDSELRIKGKAAVDVIGGRLGKALGGYTQQLAFLITAGSIFTALPFFTIIIFAALAIWIVAVFKLNSRYTKLVESQQS